MEVTFSEGGRYKFACYRLTYEESKSPDRIAKIKADFASKGKDGYSIAITYDAVSYTHLDVYKRQVQNGTKECCCAAADADHFGAARGTDQTCQIAAAFVC